MIKEFISFLQRGTVTPIDGLPAVAMPNDVRIASTIHLADDAPRKTGTIGAESLESLVDYVERHRGNDSAVFASANNHNITGVIDWHSKSSLLCESVGTATGVAQFDRGGFARHQVSLPLQFSEQWKAWAKINGQNLQQKALAEFIEEYLGDIVEPDAAAVLEAVLTLSGKKSVNYKNATRLANGDVSLVWEETTESKAGQTGDLKVPSELKLRLPVYAGCEEETTFEIRTMFRYNIHDGALTFQLKMLGIERIREMAFEAVYESLVEKLAKRKIEVPVYHGSITNTPLQVYGK